MSGHSRWAQIKHKKALSDAKKGKLFSKLARLIIVAAKEKGSDPSTNPSLRMATEKARAVGMPKDNIERAIERSSGTFGGELEEVLYEAYGPGGAALIIQGVTDSKNRTTSEIKHILSEHGGKIAQPGSVEWMFEKVGALDIVKEKNTMSADELALAVIDAGASDIKEYDESITVFVNPVTVEQLKTRLIEKGLVFEEAYTDYNPKSTLKLDEKNRQDLKKIIDALDEHDDVQEVFTNVEDL